MKWLPLTILVLGNICIATSFPSLGCPDQCHCVEVSQDAPANLQEYMEKYDWVEGMKAIGCWGRSKMPNVPEEFKQDVNYVVLVGAKKAKKLGKGYQGDQPVYQPAISIVMTESSSDNRNSQLKSIPANSFRGMSHLLQLDISDNRLKRIRGDEFHGLQNLRVLTLRGNRVRNLPPGVFQNLTNVVRLDISENRLRGIDDTTFYDLRNLRQLSINDNLVRTLSDSAFNSLQNLEILNLANNRIRDIPSELFTDLQRLRTLNLDGNRLRLLSYEYFSGMSNLEILSLKGNRISQVSHYVFYYVPNLKRLDLSHNNLVAIEQTMLWSQKQLSDLDLSHNNISEVGDLAFQHATNLSQVNLENNKIARVTSLTLSGLKSLKNLKLSSNNIQDLDTDAFKDVSNVVSLTLSNNKLERLTRGLLYGLRELNALYLDGNRLKDIEGDELKTTHSAFDSKLQWVYLRGNNLKTLGPNIFSQIPYVDLLDLSYNEITDIDMDAFVHQMSLKTLLLNNNKLSEISDGRLRTMQNLVTLNVAHNQIEKISRGALTGMESIKDLNLEGNKLESLSSTNLYDIHTVEELNLNNNKLVHLPTELFTSMHNLKVLLLANNDINTLTMPLYPQVQLSRLDLSNNELDRIRGYITVALKEDAMLGLSGNPWKCDCNIKNMLQINANSESSIQLTNVDDLLCSVPTYHKGRRIMDLRESDLTCDLETHRRKAAEILGQEYEPQAVPMQPSSSSSAGSRLHSSYGRSRLSSSSSSSSSSPSRSSSSSSSRSSSSSSPSSPSSSSHQNSNTGRQPSPSSNDQRAHSEVPKEDSLRWPWHALLWDARAEKLLCHGALIGNQWVITTKSCFDKFLMVDWSPLNARPSSDLVLYPNDVVVRLGKSEDLLGFESTEQVYGINRVFAPASAFDFVTLVSGRDSPVLVELRAQVSLDKNVRPISLEFGGFYGSSATTATEGAMSFWAADRNTRTRKDQLRFARTETVSCQLNSDRYSVCAISDDTRPGLDPSVTKNVGAPLVTREGANAWRLKGIKTKLNDGQNKVFLKLREYTDWLYRRVQL